MGKRINVSLEDEPGEALQKLHDRINKQREAKGLEPVFMRALIGACIMRCVAMDSVFLCGELITKETDCEPD